MEQTAPSIESLYSVRRWYVRDCPATVVSEAASRVHQETNPVCGSLAQSRWSHSLPVFWVGTVNRRIVPKVQVKTAWCLAGGGRGRSPGPE